MQVKIKLLTKEALLPMYETPGAACMDLRADITRDRRAKQFPGCDRGKCVMVYPHSTELIQTGIAIELPQGYEAQIRPRSGLSRNGLIVANSPGTIDSDYRGEVMVMVHNRSQDPFYIYQGDRIAQMAIKEVIRATWELVNELSDTKRGGGGFGSTGSS